MVSSNRQRLITALVLIACMLFQQAAMAAYACTMTQAPALATGMAEGCDAAAPDLAESSMALCQKHCAPDATSASTQSPLEVPALGLPPVNFGLMFSEAPGQAALVPEVALARSDPPPRLRYCRLLI